MKILLDADVIFDFISARLPFYHDARKIFILAENKEIEAHTLPHLIVNVWQIRGHMKISSTEMKKSLRQLVKIINILDETGQSALNAVHLNRTDLEDSVTIECAIKHGMDYIISRNVKHFKNTGGTDGIPAITPAEFLIKHYPDF